MESVQLFIPKNQKKRKPKSSGILVHSEYVPLKQMVNDVLVGSLGLVVTMIEHTHRLDSTAFLTNS